LEPPIATLELAPDYPSFRQRIDRGDEAANRKMNLGLVKNNTYLDLFFIPLYCSVFILLASQGSGSLARLATFAIVAAGLFDYLEDYFLFHSLTVLESNGGSAIAPGIASHIKWSLIAATCWFLAGALFRNRDALLAELDLLRSRGATPRWVIWASSRAILPALVCAGALLFFAQGYNFLFKYSFLAVLAVIAASLVCLLPIPLKDTRVRWINYLYFIRFSLLLWLIMPTLALLDASGATTSITLGILTPERGWQLFYSAFFVTTSGWLALTLARVVCAYGEERFGTKPPGQFTIETNMRWRTFLLAQTPGLLLLLRVGYNTVHQGGRSTHAVVIYFVLGALAAFTFWLVLAILYYWTYRRAAPVPRDGVPTGVAPAGRSDSKSQKEPTAKAFLIPEGPFFHLDKLEALPNPPLGAFVRWILSHAAAMGPGYKRPDAEKLPSEERLHSGHSISAFHFAGYLALYVGLMGITSPRFLPLVSWPVRGLVLITLGLAAWNFIAGSRIAPTSAPSPPLPPPSSGWYRFLQIFATAILLFFAIAVLIQPHSDRSFPVLASVFVLITFATLLLSGLAFWADHYRIPVLTLTLVLLTVTNLRPFRVDHQFTGPAPPQDLTLRTPQAILKAMEPDGHVRPLIIVTATGGGIHAATWTARVLEELENRLPGDPNTKSHGFHDSILLMSTVSGGSVGAMYFLREYNHPDSFRTASLDDRLVSSAACSSLEAVAWGLIYPDLTRIVLPVLYHLPHFPILYDRGLALEQAIAFNRNDYSCDREKRTEPKPGTRFDEDPSLSAFVDGAGETVPAFTLNTTAAETGDRFLLANYQIPAQYGGSTGNDVIDVKDCRTAPGNANYDRLPASSFLQTFAEPCPGDTHPLVDLSLSTAARLSASFTYVSPATRLEPKFAGDSYHFVDGGYFDNDGTGSVIEFLDSIARADAFPAGQPILLIEIRNGGNVYSTRSPESYSCQTTHCTAPNSAPTPWGPWRQLIAPAEAMYLAGHESITRRNRRELCTLEEELRHGNSRVVIRHVVFPIEDTEAALSWHLTQAQIAYIRKAIDQKEAKKAFDDASGWFKAFDTPTSTPAPTETCRVYPDGQ
jgi:hypothetical protein